MAEFAARSYARQLEIENGAHTHSSNDGDDTLVNGGGASPATDDQITHSNSDTLSAGVNGDVADFDDIVASPNIDIETVHSDTVPAPEPPGMPTLLEQALAAVAEKSKSRGILGKGDMAIVLSKIDLTKTILLESTTLARHIFAFGINHHNHHDHAAQPSSPKVVQGIQYLFVLETNGTSDGSNHMPIIVPKAINTAAPPMEMTVVSDSADESQATRVKDEPTEDSDQHRLADAAPHPQDMIDWARAYEVFFRIMLSKSSISVRQVRLPISATLALSVLEGVVAIAKTYDCTQAIGSAFKSLSSDWVSNRTLYPAVAATPVAWLALSIKLESELVYKEAFVHVVGQYSDVAANLDKFPDHVVASVASQAQELKIKRFQVDQQLLTTTLRVEQAAKGKLGAVNGPVSQVHAPIIYNTVNIWRDYVAEHISGLQANAEDRSNVPNTLFCEHPVSPGQSQPECLTVAGFYRVLLRADEAYLSADEVVESWNRKAFGDGFATIRANLQVLKAQAREIVAPLVRSSLQLADKEREALTYLTCVEAGKVPWAGDEDDMDVDD